LIPTISCIKAARGCRKIRPAVVKSGSPALHMSDNNFRKKGWSQNKTPVVKSGILKFLTFFYIKKQKSIKTLLG